jgi:nucleoside-diphosphate-sugar epimerase
VAYSTPWTERRILLTGASGFLGSSVRRLLHQGGAAVLAVDVRPPLDPLPGQEHRILDLSDRAATRALLREHRPEAVIHLAGLLGAERNWEFARRAVDVNFLAPFALMEELSALEPVPRLVLAGSSEEYGNARRTPIDEECPDAPVSPYSLSKSMATRSALMAHALWGFPVVVLRPFIIYGPGQSGPMFVPSLLRALAGGVEFAMTAGDQVRDFVHVEDVARAFALAAFAPRAEGQIINVASGLGLPLRRVAELAMELPGRTGWVKLGALPYRLNEAWNLVGSPERSRGVLGWKAEIPFEEGLRSTWARARKEVAT